MARKVWKRDHLYEHNADGEQLIPSKVGTTRSRNYKARIQGMNADESAPMRVCFDCDYSFAWFSFSKNDWLCEMCGGHCNLGRVVVLRTVARYVYDG